jgi:penicillin-binding protein 2
VTSLYSQRSDVSEFKKRFRWIALAMAVLFLGLVGRLFELQVVEGEDHRAIARENIVRKITLATTRGIIRDRTGVVLAASRPAYNIYVVPANLVMDRVWPKLVDYLGLGVDEAKRLEDKITTLQKADGPRKNQQILLKEDISRDAVANLATHEGELRGPKDVRAVEVVPTPVRFYPSAEVGAHVLGYMAEVDSERLAQLRSSGYVEGDRIGATGVERSWESYLRGTRGWDKVLVDAHGRRRQAGDGIIDEPRRSDPIPGRDLRLTIDAELERTMDKAFRGELAGGAVLVDVRTGRLLALYSKPSFDPNALSGGSGKQVIADAFRRLNGDPLHPGIDKTVAGAYPPGSTFKPFTALAALEKGLIDQHVVQHCKGFITYGKRTFRCTHVHGMVDLHKAIAESCNIYFFNLAKEYGVGMDLIAEMGQRFGFGQKTGLGVNAEAAGRMPTKAWMTLRNKGHFQLGFGLNAAIGQGATTVSVLQLALAYAALANGGTLYQPELVRAVETSNGTVVQEFNPRVRRQMDIKPENLALVQKALTAGVNDVGGTAYLTHKGFGEVTMAGKTGTAQVSHHVTRGGDAERVWYFNREHAWFAAYAPVRSPEVAIVVLVEHGGAGGKHAAPIAFEVVRKFQELQREKRGGQRAAGQSPGQGRAKAPSPGGQP